MRIVHISDTHGKRFHEKMVIPECDVLVHTGDFGDWKTSLAELTEFLIWFEKQPAKVKIFISGNHDIIMDAKWVYNRGDAVSRMLATQQHRDALILIQAYDVVYLNNTDYVYEGVKFWGSPMSPTFGSDWAFNADKGTEISKYWAKIPSDVNVLLTHTPVYGYLDSVTDKYMREGETDYHKGDKDLLEVIKKRLLKLKLHCSGHIHDEYGIVLEHISNTRRVMFSNGAIITNDAIQLVTKPLIIDL